MTGNERKDKVQRRREPKPTLTSALKQAEKAGKPVKQVIIEAGRITLQFGEPEHEQTNDLDKWIAKHHAN